MRFVLGHLNSDCAESVPIEWAAILKHLKYNSIDLELLVLVDLNTDCAESVSVLVTNGHSRPPTLKSFILGGDSSDHREVHTAVSPKSALPF